MTDKTDQRARLTLSQLEVFASIARSGSMRAAAGRVARSQSAASSALAEQESALGAQEFDRVGRRLVLNENGRDLLPTATGIVETAKAEGADLIVMGSHGRSGIARLMLGSVATKVVAESPIPVLVTR